MCLISDYIVFMKYLKKNTIPAVATTWVVCRCLAVICEDAFFITRNMMKLSCCNYAAYIHWLGNAVMKIHHHMTNVFNIERIPICRAQETY